MFVQTWSIPWQLPSMVKQSLFRSVVSSGCILAMGKQADLVIDLDMVLGIGRSETADEELFQLAEYPVQTVGLDSSNCSHPHRFRVSKYSPNMDTFDILA
jgi:hypothetical protein